MANKYVTFEDDKIYLVDEKKEQIYEHPLKDEKLTTIQKDFFTSRLQYTTMEAVSGKELNTNQDYAEYDVLQLK